MTDDPILDHLAATMRRKLHVHAVGTKMFCPACRDVLDISRAVSFDLNDVTRVLCGECFDRIPEAKRADLTDVHDGRPAPKPEPTIGKKRRGLGTWSEATIRTKDGDETVLAWVRPKGRFHLRPVCGNWFLTHVATGFVMFQTANQKNALAAVRRAESLPDALQASGDVDTVLDGFRALHGSLKAEGVIL